MPLAWYFVSMAGGSRKLSVRALDAPVCRGSGTVGALSSTAREIGICVATLLARLISCSSGNIGQLATSRALHHLSVLHWLRRAKAALGYCLYAFDILFAQDHISSGICTLSFVDEAACCCRVHPSKPVGTLGCYAYSAHAFPSPAVSGTWVLHPTDYCSIIFWERSMRHTKRRSQGLLQHSFRLGAEGSLPLLA